MSKAATATRAGPRERLIAAAADLIEASSYETSSVAAICEEAGVQKGSFYYYFPSKQALVLAMIDDSWDGFRESLLEPLLDGPEPVRDRVVRLYRCLYEAQVSHKETLGHVTGCLFGSLAAESSTLDEPVRRRLFAVFEEWAAYLTRALAEAIAGGELGWRRDPEQLAWTVLANMQGMLLLCKTADDPEVMRTAANTILEMIFDHEAA